MLVADPFGGVDALKKKVGASEDERKAEITRHKTKMVSIDHKIASYQNDINELQVKADEYIKRLQTQMSGETEDSTMQDKEEQKHGDPSDTILALQQKLAQMEKHTQEIHLHYYILLGLPSGLGHGLAQLGQAATEVLDGLGRDVGLYAQVRHRSVICNKI